MNDKTRNNKLIKRAVSVMGRVPESLGVFMEKIAKSSKVKWTL